MLFLLCAETWWGWALTVYVFDLEAAGEVLRG